MKVKKIIYLFLALGFPVVIFLFLKQFGTNEFHVEPLLQVHTSPQEPCHGYVYKFPYTLADSVLTRIEWNNSDSLTLVIFDNSTLEDSHERSIQMARILKEIKGEDYKMVYTTTFDILKTNFNDKRLISLKDSVQLATLRSCALWLPSYEDVALINSRKQIVGKYSLLNREDADRLILEMKILLRQY